MKVNFKSIERLVLTFVLVAVCFSVNAQSPKGTVGSWLMVFNQTRLSDKISLHSEFQFRSYEVKPNAEQLLPRIGINYHLNKSSFVTAGYAWIPNYAYDKDLMAGIQVKENRVWEQYQLRNKISRTVFDHRLRLEQRWIETNTETKTQYKNRFRYLLRSTIPLNNPTLQAGTWFLSFYDEIFLNLTDTPFDRNRLYGAAGYQFNPLVNFQLGYMAQTVKSTTKPYLQATLTYNLDLRRK